MWKDLFGGQRRADAETNESLYKKINHERLPAHTAIIMDGNGRWAEKRGLLRTAGHTAGVDALREILRVAVDIKLQALTVYAFSTENWKRPSDEVDFLMNLFVDYLAKEIEEMHRDNIKLRFLGRVDELSPTLRDLARTAVERMKDNTGLLFNVGMNYGGQDEILRAVRKVAKLVGDGAISPEEADGALFESFLDTAGLPPVDLVIRTSGDMRLSNFLLWQTAYAELWFTDTNWPDFTPERFIEALDAFGSRKRRFGGLKNT